MKTEETLTRIYDLLYAHYEDTGWWPAETDEEIVIGAILTQNTNWKNVEKALANLRNLGSADFNTIRKLDTHALAMAVKPSGYFNQKSDRLKIFVSYVDTHYSGLLKELFKLPLSDLRRNLLSIKGIGPETADDIILYAAEKPVFVIDAYTKIIISRHLLCQPDVKYDEIQILFHNAVKPDVEIYQNYHAMLVRLAKDYCTKKNPACETCPLNSLPHKIL